MNYSKMNNIHLHFLWRASIYFQHLMAANVNGCIINMLLDDIVFIKLYRMCL